MTRRLTISIVVSLFWIVLLGFLNTPMVLAFPIALLSGAAVFVVLKTQEEDIGW